MDETLGLEPATRSSHSLRDLLARSVDAAPTATALAELDGRSITFSELQQRVSEIEATIPKGARRIGVGLQNDIDSVAGLFAAWRSGASVVALSGSLPDNEIERRVLETHCDAVLGRDSIKPAALPGTAPSDGDEALVIFTSGTTGRPKGTVLTFDGLASSLQGISTGSGLGPEGRAPLDPARRPIPLFTPLSHMAGAIGLLSGLYLGKPLLLVPKFDVATALRMVDEFEVTNLKLTPTMVYDLLRWPTERQLPGVRSVTVGSAAIPEATRIGFEERYGIPVLQNYGQTEFAGAIAFERYSDVSEGKRPRGSVGRVAPGVEVKIVDTTGEIAAPGDAGEIWARGGGAMAGYLGTDGRAVEKTESGWLATGDLGTIDADGFLSILGRVRDVINCGGFNIYPAVVEVALNGLPGVVDSAVTGLADARLGEIPVAAIVVDTDSNEVGDLRTLLRDELAPYEIPRRSVVVTALPRTANGKIDRPAVGRLLATDS